MWGYIPIKILKILFYLSYWHTDMLLISSVQKQNPPRPLPQSTIFRSCSVQEKLCLRFLLSPCQTHYFCSHNSTKQLMLWPPLLNSKDDSPSSFYHLYNKPRQRMKWFGWHHWLSGNELGQTLGDGEGQGGLACCSPWGHKESDMTGWLNNNADDTTLMAESGEELKSLLTRVKEENEKAGLKLNIKVKIMASSPITSWQIDGEKVEAVTDFLFLGSKITADSDSTQRWN